MTRWKAFFVEEGIAPVRVEYETLAACPRREMRRILSALHVPCGLADSLEAQTSKMADAESDAWGERFRRERGCEA
jgi:LPS sulfotransferase NodH